ncbi:TetR/AcrR family transcriptional regulator [Parvularcula sp. LCG005]|uniref:TetR/AcrR family transcriptional regulator n=1 Tax=Parvularcula sp. LCG005 TaxID=3078805 RepID=UPI0029431E31|nr:TetR/AcrR family transcriptional regulator [Parvularcula sp. LCG005]WOI53725.1 TetR/AcrR family transcriptional regulator [Parvularcula sp. LCG005]
MSTTERPADAATRLTDAALTLFRQQGYAATSVNELCTAAGVSKGAFFHHFPNKDALAIAAARAWATGTGAMFAAADYHDLSNAADRVLAYLDLRIALLDGPLPEITCYAGTMVQEIYEGSTDIRDACAEAIFGHASTLEDDIAAALNDAGNSEIDAAGLSRHLQAVLQGGFILSKAKGDSTPAKESVEHLKRYLDFLFTPQRQERRK